MFVWVAVIRLDYSGILQTVVSAERLSEFRKIVVSLKRR